MNFLAILRQTAAILLYVAFPIIQQIVKCTASLIYISNTNVQSLETTDVDDGFDEKKKKKM